MTDNKKKKKKLYAPPALITVNIQKALANCDNSGSGDSDTCFGNGNNAAVECNGNGLEAGGGCMVFGEGN